MLDTKEDRELSLIIYLLLLNPILDLLTGLYLNVFQLNSKFTPGIIVRNFILLYMIYYVWKNKIKIKYLVLLGITFILTNIAQIYSGVSTRLFLEIQYFIKFLYNLLILFIGYEIIKKQNSNYIEKIFYYFTISGVMYSLVILISFLTGTDFKTYSHGLSSKGLFFAGNDLAAILAVIYPISVYLYFKLRDVDKKWVLFYNITIMLGLIVVGTRVAFLSVFLTFIVYFVFIAVNKDKDMLKKYVIFLVISYLSFSIFSYASKVTKGIDIIDNSIQRQQMNLEKTKYDSTTYVLSSRNIKFKWAFDDYKNSNVVRKIFGIGRGTQEQTVEMDFVEVWLYYGVAGLIIMTYYIFKYGFMFLFKLQKIRSDMLYLVLFTSLFLGFGSSFLAGHVLFSVSAGTYSFLVLALSTKIYAED